MPQYHPYRHHRLATRGIGESEAARHRLREAWTDLGEVVYFVRRHGLIKIGYSSRLRDRLTRLKAQPSDLLVITPGGYMREQELHQRFKHLRVTGPGLGCEHYHPAHELMACINELRAGYGLDLLAA